LGEDQGVNEKNLKSAIRVMQRKYVTSQSAEETYNLLNKYARNFKTSWQMTEKTDPIKRDEESEEFFHPIAKNQKQSNTVGELNRKNGHCRRIGA
jgi:ATP-dependent Clp protease ATP-binding subunit ClpA